MATGRAAAAYVLTGGESRRMGGDKALLEIGGRPTALRMVELARPLVAEVALVGAPERYGHLGVPVLVDCEAKRAPLTGIVTALRATQHDWNLLLACDLPFWKAFWRAALGSERGRHDAVVPKPADGWQPLCAAYHRRCLPAFERVLASAYPKISVAFDDLWVRALTPELLAQFAFDPRMFKNMNSREDYEEAKRILESV
jgi:molybdopterin-guanine dinucleotide biosynthesis protein A